MRLMMLTFRQQLQIKRLLFNAWERAFLANTDDTEERILGELYDNYTPTISMSRVMNHYHG